MTSKGQVTIPKAIRNCLNLHTGDRLLFIIDRKGRIILTAQTMNTSALFGIIKSKKRLTDTIIKKTIAKTTVRRFVRAGH